MSTTIPNKNIRDTEDFILDTPILHNEGVKTQHWQLKDMLKIHNEHLIFPQSNTIFSYAYQTENKHQLTEELKFAPTSFCAYKDHLVVGGSKGQLYVKNLISDEFQYSYISENINNHINIHNDLIYVSNNDKSLRILSLDNEEYTTIEFISQVNFSSVSPDNKYLILVGDSNDVYVYSIEHSSYRLIKKLKTMRDGGFSVSWNNLSNKFAVATQDGYVCIWDIRSDEKLTTLNSEQQGSHKGAIRNVFFSRKKSLDLLFFTEQSSYLNAFDTRTFEKRHLVNVSRDLQITGATISEENCKIFVSSDTDIYEYDINTISRRIFDTK
jgi:WD40 repeat protein